MRLARPTPAMLWMLQNLPCPSTAIPSVYGSGPTWDALVRRGWAYYSRGRLEISNPGRAVRTRYGPGYHPNDPAREG